jgi:hypothetical protein
LRKHGHQGVEDSVDLMFISSSDFNEHVLGGQLDLGMVRVDDGRQRAHSMGGIEHHRVHRGVTDDM